MKTRLNSNQKVTDEPFDSGSSEAFATGLFTLSEIVFNNHFAMQ